MQLDLFLDQVIWTKIGWSVLFGFLIGLERQLHKKPIDIRMSVLICLGTMFFIHLGTLVPGSSDATRVLGQVVTGIGFLGAGAIITRSGFVVGLTSAAVVWTLASIGAAIGFGFYEIAAAVSITTMIVLTTLQWFENFMEHLIKIDRK